MEVIKIRLEDKRHRKVFRACVCVHESMCMCVPESMCMCVSESMYMCVPESMYTCVHVAVRG